ncbi:MAG TPA: crotonyl-CoA carboxylase/reductase [Actinomycetota bacterium]|jgi:crotonyl-CoA carboxylase/reductase|nr:crotonyl-CoA carboxylase/reductase [Actinomycetota bacterium]
MTNDLFDIGEIPEIGTVPARMHAQLVRPERFGEPQDSIKDEVIDVPEIGPNEALVMVMAAGVNFNNVWAARGVPVDVTKTQARWGEPTDFHIVGSDAAGIVYSVGRDVTNVNVGDRVVVHAGQWDIDDPWVVAGKDPGLAASFRVWGYDTCWGSFAQFTKVQAHQCLPKADHLTWEEAAAPTLTGGTAYRMLHGWPPNTVSDGDVVLVWGGSGGLGSMAIQLVTLAGGRPVAVVSSDEKGEYCMGLGAVGYVNRTRFDHWGVPPAWNDPAWKEWFEGAKAFGKAVWEALGERTSPRIVFEHPAQDTIPTSNFVCDRGGMVVICAGTTGYDTMIDVRYLWYLQKRYQGSHLFNDEQAAAFNDLVRDRKVSTTLSATYVYDETGAVHQMMGSGELPEGNVAVLVNAPARGLTDLP